MRARPSRDVQGGQPGLRDLALLRSAMGMPETTFEGGFRHGTVFEMAAACSFHIARNHTFADANRQTALIRALGFLAPDGHRLEAPPAAPHELVDGAASGSVDRAEVAVFLQRNSGAR